MKEKDLDYLAPLSRAEELTRNDKIKMFALDYSIKTLGDVEDAKMIYRQIKEDWDKSPPVDNGAYEYEKDQ